MIAITAASGRLGRAVLRNLARDFPQVPLVAVLRTPSKLQGFPQVEKRSADYASIDDMTAALRGASALVLVSAPVVPGTDRIALHRNVIEAARRAGVRKVLYSSVIGNGAEMQTSFAGTQRVNRQAEADVAASGMEWIVARNGFYLDIDVARMKSAAQATGVYESSAGDGRCGYLTIDEIAYATSQLIAGGQPAGRIYNLVGESIGMKELTRQVAEVFGLSLEYRAISDVQRLANVRADSLVTARGGEDIAQMLAGLAHGQRLGAFDVPSDFVAAAGRPCRSLREMLLDLRGLADPAA